MRVGFIFDILVCYSGTHRDLPASMKTFTTEEPLSLRPGGLYYVRVAAVNRAGLTAVHETDGVIVDNSPPVVSSNSHELY